MGQEKSFKTELEKVVKQKVRLERYRLSLTDPQIEVEGLKRKLEIELSKRAEQDDKRRPEAQSFQGIENDLSPRKRELNRGECAREMDTELSSDELSPPPEFPLSQMVSSVLLVHRVSSVCCVLISARLEPRSPECPAYNSLECLNEGLKVIQ